MYLIRVSSSKNYGKGHINRCLFLRKSFNDKTIWIVDNGTKNLVSSYINKDEIIEENYFNSLVLTEKIIKSKGIVAIIIDTPLLDKIKIKNIANLIPTIIIVDKVIKIQNTLSICPHPIKYNAVNFISGLHYYPFKKKKRNKNNFNILISLGFTDKNKLTETVIKIFKEIVLEYRSSPFKYKIHIVAGDFFNNVEEIKRIILNNKNFKLHTNLSNLEKLYKVTDFAIGAPGFSQLERLEYCIPTILIPQSSTHKNLLDYWEKINCACVVFNVKKNLKKKIEELLYSKNLKNKVIKNIEIFIRKNKEYNFKKEIDKFIKSYKEI